MTFEAGDTWDTLYVRDETRAMAAKREREEKGGLATTEGAEIMTADMAAELREKLIEQKRRKTKKAARTGPTIHIGKPQQIYGRASFFGLSQELRDEVYRYLWEETPLIRQQYERKYYLITYGERHDLLSWDVERRTACCLSCDVSRRHG